MIRAVYRDGLIYPAEPVPSDWADGQSLSVESVAIEPSDDSNEISRWDAAWRKAGPIRYEPGERERVQALLAEADAQAKEAVRRRMESGR